MRVTLRQDDLDQRYYIAKQEDFYQPEDLFFLTLPFFAHFVVLVKVLTAQLCTFLAILGAVLGFSRLWRPDTRITHPSTDNGDVPTADGERPKSD